MVGRPYRLYSKASVRLPVNPVAEKSDFPQWLKSHTRCGDAAVSNATINAKTRHGNSAHMGDGYFALKIAAMPLHGYFDS